MSPRILPQLPGTLPNPLTPAAPTAPPQLPGLDELLMGLQQGPAPPPTMEGVEMPSVSPTLSGLLQPYRAPGQGGGLMGLVGGPTAAGGTLGGGGGYGGGYSGGGSALPGAIGGTTSTATGATGSYTGSGPLMNGQSGNAQDYGLDPSTLATRGGVTMVRPALEQLIAAQQQLGIPVLAAVSGGFRTEAEQRAMDPDGDGYGSSGQLVAAPGSSMHEAGRAVDIDTNFVLAHPELRRWLDQAGWVNAVTGEPWHWEYQGPINMQTPSQQPQQPQQPAGPRRAAPSPSPRPQPSSTPTYSGNQQAGGGAGKRISSPKPQKSAETSARRRRAIRS